MPTKRNRLIGEYTDYDANIRHYQDINNQIERKTIAVLETASKFGNESEKQVPLQYYSFRFQLPIIPVQFFQYRFKNSVAPTRRVPKPSRKLQERPSK